MPVALLLLFRSSAIQLSALNRAMINRRDYHILRTMQMLWKYRFYAMMKQWKITEWRLWRLIWVKWSCLHKVCCIKKQRPASKFTTYLTAYLPMDFWKVDVAATLKFTSRIAFNSFMTVKMMNYSLKIMETDSSQIKMLFAETTPRLKIYNCIYLL